MINKYYFDLENLLLCVCVYELNDRLIQNTKCNKKKNKNFYNFFFILKKPGRNAIILLIS